MAIIDTAVNVLIGAAHVGCHVKITSAPIFIPSL
jgi:hypothetical protein